MRQVLSRNYHQWLLMLIFLIFISATLAMPYNSDEDSFRRKLRKKHKSMISFDDPKAPWLTRRRSLSQMDFGDSLEKSEKLNTRKNSGRRMENPSYGYGFDENDQADMPTTIHYTFTPFQHQYTQSFRYPPPPPSGPPPAPNFYHDPSISYQNFQRLPPPPYYYNNPFIHAELGDAPEGEGTTDGINESSQSEIMQMGENSQMFETPAKVVVIQSENPVNEEQQNLESNPGIENFNPNFQQPVQEPVTENPLQSTVPMESSQNLNEFINSQPQFSQNLQQSPDVQNPNIQQLNLEGSSMSQNNGESNLNQQMEISNQATNNQQQNFNENFEESNLGIKQPPSEVPENAQILNPVPEITQPESSQTQDVQPESSQLKEAKSSDKIPQPNENAQPDSSKNENTLKSSLKPESSQPQNFQPEKTFEISQSTDENSQPENIQNYPVTQNKENPQNENLESSQSPLNTENDQIKSSQLENQAIPQTNELTQNLQLENEQTNQGMENSFINPQESVSNTLLDELPPPPSQMPDFSIFSSSSFFQGLAPQAPQGQTIIESADNVAFPTNQPESFQQFNSFENQNQQQNVQEFPAPPQWVTNHPDYAPIPTQDLGEGEEEYVDPFEQHPNYSPFLNHLQTHSQEPPNEFQQTFDNRQPEFVSEIPANQDELPRQFQNPVVVQETLQPSESSNAAYSYHNVVLNPFAKLSEQRLPEMGFVFHPTILRVQQPHLILNELRHFKIQLDQSPIMDALFSPATVPIPPAVPWPSNYVAQRYLPPPEIFTLVEYPMKQQENHNQPSQDMRRAFPNVLNMPSPESIEKSIAQSMSQNSARFQSQFNFPNMRRAFPNIPSADAIQKSIADSMAKNSANFQSHFNFPNMPNQMRRLNIPGIPTADSIQKSIAESMSKNSIMFASQFLMPDISKAIDGIIQSSANQNSPSSSLVQIGNGNKNYAEADDTRRVLQINNMNDEVEVTTTELNTEAPTTEWPGDLKAMNQVAETTTIESTTISAETTESPKIKSTTVSEEIESTTMKAEESTTINLTTSMNDITTNEAFLTTFDSLTTENPNETTTESTTDETTTFESTTFEIDDRIDPKVIATLLG